MINGAFSSTTAGADIINGIATTSWNMFDGTLPFWKGWFGIGVALFFSFGIALCAIIAVRYAIGFKR